MFLAPLAVLPFDDAAFWAYGSLRADLERRGTPIGALDTLIAAHALSQQALLVTHDTRELAQVPGLQLADWTGAPTSVSSSSPATRWYREAGCRRTQPDAGRALLPARTGHPWAAPVSHTPILHRCDACCSGRPIPAPRASWPADCATTMPD